MTQTIQVAADRSYDETKTVLPTEVARGVYIENPPSAEALKLMHLLINRAGGRMAEDVRHELRLADIKTIEGMRNHSRPTLRKLFAELAGAVMIFDDTEAQCEIIGGFLDRAKLDYRHEVSDDLLIAWWFGGAFREMAEQSCHWAILDRQTVFALSSKYSILFFQHIASLLNLDHITGKTFTVSELRVVMGVPERKIKRFADLNRDVLKPAIAEISQLSRLTLTATPHKIGRTVASVEIAWEVKPDPLEVKRELDLPKVGRKARLDGSAETPVLAFPETGGTVYSEPWDTIRKANCNWDQATVADKFRQFLAAKGIKNDAQNIETLFTNYCAKLPKI